MKILTYVSTIVLMFTLIACGNNSAEVTAPQTDPTGSKQPVTVTDKPSVHTPTNQGETVKLNPAHGHSGHRCDIAVGAPLTQTATPNTVIQKQVTPASTPLKITTPTITNSTATLGLNPAHGQPGHRCDIAVGAPLTQTATPNTVIQKQVTPASTPLKITTPTITNSTAASGLNPAHGHSGHRCDIAVGAPLKQ